MTDIEYISVLVKGLTFGATFILALTMFTEINNGNNSRWRKYLLGTTGIVMATHAMTLIYRFIVDLNGYTEVEYFMYGSIMLDMLCIPPLAIVEMMLTRHTILKPKATIGIYSPFVIFAALYFITGLALVKSIAIGFAIIASIAWAIMTYRDMRRYTTLLKQTYSDFEGRDLSWLSHILYILAFVLVIWSASTFIGTHSAKVIYRLMIVLIWFLVCRRIYVQKEAVEIDDLSAKDGSVFHSKKTDESVVDPKVFLVGKQVEEIMHTKQLYKQFGITSTQIAQELNCNKTLIAQFFSSKGTTFHSYVNDLRMDYAAERLLKTKDTMMDIAKQSGYQFDNIFYREFQHKFGCTPHEYRNKFRLGSNN